MICDNPAVCRVRISKSTSLLKNMRKSMIFAVYDDKFYIEHGLNGMLNVEIVILT